MEQRKQKMKEIGQKGKCAVVGAGRGVCACGGGASVLQNRTILCVFYITFDMMSHTEVKMAI